MLELLKWRVRILVKDFAYKLLKVLDSPVYNHIYVVFTHVACGSNDVLPTDELGGRKWDCGKCRALVVDTVIATPVDPSDPEVAYAIRTGSYPVYRL